MGFIGNVDLISLPLSYNITYKLNGTQNPFSSCTLLCIPVWDRFLTVSCPFKRSLYMLLCQWVISAVEGLVFCSMSLKYRSSAISHQS